MLNSPRITACVVTAALVSVVSGGDGSTRTEVHPAFGPVSRPQLPEPRGFGGAQA
jgi:hypothetical protein